VCVCVCARRQRDIRCWSCSLHNHALLHIDEPYTTRDPTRNSSIVLLGPPDTDCCTADSWLGACHINHTYVANKVLRRGFRSPVVTSLGVTTSDSSCRTILQNGTVGWESRWHRPVYWQDGRAHWITLRFKIHIHRNTWWYVMLLGSLSFKNEWAQNWKHRNYVKDMIIRQTHAAQHTTHNHNQAHSKHRTTHSHTQKHDMLPQHQT